MVNCQCGKSYTPKPDEIFGAEHSSHCPYCGAYQTGPIYRIIAKPATDEDKERPR